MNFDQEIGQRVYRLAKSLGKNQSDLAALLGFTTATISRKISAKESTLTFEDLKKIIPYLETSWEYVMTGSEKTTESEYSQGALRIARI